MPGGEPDHEEAALPGDRSQGGLGVVAADAVVDDVDALAARQVLRARLQVLARVVDDLVRTAIAADGELLGGGRRGDHPCAHQLAELDGGEADVAGGAEHEERLAGLESTAVVEAVVARAVGVAETRRLGVAHVLRELAGRTRPDEDLLREAAHEQRIPDDALTEGEALDVGSELGHDARGLAPRHEGQRRLELVFVLDHQRIGKGHGRRPRLDHELAGPGRGIGSLLEHELLRRTELPTNDGSHGDLLRVSRDARSRS